MNLRLNERGLARCDSLLQRSEEHAICVDLLGCGTRIVDCGVKSRGGLEAGRAMAEVCLAGLGDVSIVPGDTEFGPSISVATDQPIAACLASQYAGWPIQSDKPKYFAMGSGPMRASRGREELLGDIDVKEQPEAAIGVLESGKLPPDEVCRQIAEQCSIAVEKLTLLIAPTASLAGTIQIVSRSVETALHKLHELKFDLSRVQSGFGVAPLPPVAADDMAGIGRTNDAVLYGGNVTLWVTGDDTSLEEIGPRIPSSSSPDFGEPFAKIFERYDYDFYKIDPLLFSPAVITLINCETGKAFRFGKTRDDVLRASFYED